MRTCSTHTSQTGETLHSGSISLRDSLGKTTVCKVTSFPLKIMILSSSPSREHPSTRGAGRLLKMPLTTTGYLAAVAVLRTHITIPLSAIARQGTTNAAQTASRTRFCRTTPTTTQQYISWVVCMTCTRAPRCGSLATRLVAVSRRS